MLPRILILVSPLSVTNRLYAGYDCHFSLFFDIGQLIGYAE